MGTEISTGTAPKCNIDPEKWRLEGSNPFLLGFGHLSGANCETSEGMYLVPGSRFLDSWEFDLMTCSPS